MSNFQTAFLERKPDDIAFHMNVNLRDIHLFLALYTWLPIYSNLNEELQRGKPFMDH